MHHAAPLSPLRRPRLTAVQASDIGTSCAVLRLGGWWISQLKGELSCLLSIWSRSGRCSVRRGVAVAGFLAGYSGRTREAYALDVRMFGHWCTERHVDLFAVTRAHIGLYARWLEEQGRARATIARRLSTIVNFYRYAEEEHMIV